MDMNKIAPDGEVQFEDLVNELEKMTLEEKKQWLGEEFMEVIDIMPVPMYVNFKFNNGKTYKMCLSE